MDLRQCGNCDSDDKCAPGPPTTQVWKIEASKIEGVEAMRKKTKEVKAELQKEHDDKVQRVKQGQEQGQEQGQ
jgi:hypothetical protein